MAIQFQSTIHNQQSAILLSQSLIHQGENSMEERKEFNPALYQSLNPLFIRGKIQLN